MWTANYKAYSDDVRGWILKHLSIGSALACLFYYPCSWADTIYCTEPGGYVQLGMSKSQVEAKCGKPFDVQKKNEFDTRKVLVKQLFYRMARVTGGRGNMTFPADDSTGATLVVNTKANKVIAITLGNAGVQNVSLCKHGSFGVGDSLSAVTQACGKPIYTNQSYVTVANNTTKPIEVETWQIRLNQNYGKTLTMTFKNGILTSVN